MNLSKVFNMTGICVPKKHYMVNNTPKLVQIKKMIDREDYFTINRGRQYGKTTTLQALRKFIAAEYTVISMSFEGLGSSSFETESIFCQEFLNQVYHALNFSNVAAPYKEQWKDESIVSYPRLGEHITKLCRDKKIVLIIDEVDKASNFQVFLDFLNMLRHKFLARNNGEDDTFHSVILAGVYDIENLKSKMIEEGHHQVTQNEKEQNSPWNIATRFTIDMSFSAREINGMLVEYGKENGLVFDTQSIAEEIYFYTEGYPVLVSTVCWYIDELLNQNWTTHTVAVAVRMLVRETDNELFKSISQNLEKHKNVRDLLYDVLILGGKRSFSIDNPAIDLTFRYGYIKEVNERVEIANKIFEIRMTNYFISKDEEKNNLGVTGGLINDVTAGGKFNMALCLERFAMHWEELYNETDGKFLERQCRLIFLTFLKPILNGKGFYFIESALTDNRRMDLVVTYGQEKFILELKIWKGNLYNEEGVEQLLGYMDKNNVASGYLLTFDFRKNPVTFAPKWREESHKKVFEVRV